MTGDTARAGASVDINSARSILAAIGIMAIAPMFFLIMPLYVGALADDLGLENRQIGVLTSTELVGTSLASLLGLFWIRRFAWRRAIVASVALLLVGNVASILIGAALAPLLGLRFATGFASGSLMCVAVANLGDTDRADRNFALGIVGQLCVSGSFLFALPPLVERWGVAAVFALFSALPVLMLSGLRHLPTRGKAPPPADLPVGSTLVPLWGLFGSACFFVAATSVWAFVERIGVNAGFSSGFIGTALGFSTIVSIAGAFAASWLAGRVGRIWPMVIAALGQIACLPLLVEGVSPAVYVVAVLLYSVFWNLWVPFQMGVIAEADTSGRFVVLITFFQAAGVAIGPVLATRFLSGDNYLAVNWMGGIFAVLSLLLFVPITLRRAAGSPARG